MNIYTISFLLMLTFNIIKNKYSLILLQHNLYNRENRYLKYILNNFKRIFISLDLISMIIIIISYILNNRLTKIFIVIAIIFYLLELVRILNNKIINKSLVATKRIRRLILTIAILFMVPIIIYLKDKDNGLLLLVVESIITYFSYIIVLIAKIINTPMEKVIFRYEDIRARDKLESINNLRVVGITGTYGKTSLRNILSDVLKTKYITKKTPRNLNTEYGLVMTINKYLDPYDQVFITEMGALKQEEIRKMCRRVKPKYGIITYAGNNNIDTFKKYDRLIKTQFELIENLPSDGIAILNMDDSNQTSYNIKNKCKKIWISLKEDSKADVIGLNIKTSSIGTSFDVLFKDSKEKYHFETKLLGTYNIYNLVASITLAKELDINIKDLELTLKRVKQPKSRLELVNFGYMYQIKDTYNSNPLGIKNSLDVLKSMPGIKIVVTEGITSDNHQKQVNHIFGNQIADIADYIVLIDPKKTRQVFDGILEKGYDKDKIFVVNNLKNAYNLLKTFDFDKEIYALFENNMKDTYNE